MEQESGPPLVASGPTIGGRKFEAGGIVLRCSGGPQRRDYKGVEVVKPGQCGVAGGGRR
jgi:hypothetical protein